MNDSFKAIESRLMQLAAAAEKRNLDGVSASLGRAIREVRASFARLAAKESNIEVESWPDFLNWWNNNRGQNLVYIFQDSYGPDSEQVKMVKKLTRDAEKHEKDLHEFYRALRDIASQQMEGGGTGAADAQVTELDLEKPQAGAQAPAVEDAPPASEDEDAALDDLSLDL